MQLQLEITSPDWHFIAWRRKEGHLQNGQWVHDDRHGERSGPLGKFHLAEDGAGKTCCGKPVPAELESAGGTAALRNICQQCLQVIVRPFIP